MKIKSIIYRLCESCGVPEGWKWFTLVETIKWFPVLLILEVTSILGMLFFMANQWGQRLAISVGMTNDDWYCDVCAQWHDEEWDGSEPGGVIDAVFDPGPADLMAETPVAPYILPPLPREVHDWINGQMMLAWRPDD